MNSNLMDENHAKQMNLDETIILLEQAIETCLHMIDINLDYFKKGFPHVSNQGIYPEEENKLWTAGFFPGMTYLAYQFTKNDKYLRNRELYLNSFKQRCKEGHMETHDIGFLFLLTFGYEYKINPSEEIKSVITTAADKLFLRYNVKGHFIQAWGAINLEDTETRIIIDCMMNLEFLFMASEITGDLKYYEAAYNHALVSSETLLRKDGSTYHTYYINTKVGDYLYGKTHQGNRDDSTWARGQAWSINGFAEVYHHTNEMKFLEASIKSAIYYIQHLPNDLINYWDFDFSEEQPDIRDTSATSIAAAGFLKLAKALEKVDRKAMPITSEECYLWSGKLLKALIKDYMNNTTTIGTGILKEGMYHRNHGFNEYTIWGDYYFIEALLMYHGRKMVTIYPKA